MPTRKLRRDETKNLRIRRRPRPLRGRGVRGTRRRHRVPAHTCSRKRARVRGPMPRTRVTASGVSNPSVLASVRDDAVREGGSDAGQGLELCAIGPIEVDPCAAGRTALRHRRGASGSRAARPRIGDRAGRPGLETDMRREAARGDLPHSGDPLQVGGCAERSALPLLDERLRQARTDAGQPTQLVGRGTVHIDLFPGGERGLSPLLPGSARRRPHPRRPSGPSRGRSWRGLQAGPGRARGGCASRDSRPRARARRPLPCVPRDSDPTPLTSPRNRTDACPRIGDGINRSSNGHPWTRRGWPEDVRR